MNKLYWRIMLSLSIIISATLWASESSSSNPSPTPENAAISLNFQNIDVRAALQLLADFGGVNMIVDDSVKGNIALHMKKIPWQDALQIILTTHHLEAQMIHGVMMITPVSATPDSQTIDTENSIDNPTAPIPELTTTLIVLKYANAEELTKTLQNNKNTLLSANGHMIPDKRTNTILIQDTPESIAMLQPLIQALDTPVRQVSIEARIVTVNRDFERNLGIAFGVSQPNHLSGTLEGANALAGGTAASSVPITQRLNVDFSAESTLGATPISLGLALAKLNHGILLDLELSALESEGEGKIIASPRLVTANQQPALIESGEEIPYQETSLSGGTSVAFKKAVLRLKVTPQITINNKIMMALTVNQDMPNGILVNGVPELTTKEIQTHVLVSDGETLVLGGIYRQDKIHSTNRIPFLSQLPGIGSIFQQKTDRINTEELLIFITPRIMKETV